MVQLNETCVRMFALTLALNRVYNDKIIIEININNNKKYYQCEFSLLRFFLHTDDVFSP